MCGEGGAVAHDIGCVVVKGADEANYADGPAVDVGHLGQLGRFGGGVVLIDADGVDPERKIGALSEALSDG